MRLKFAALSALSSYPEKKLLLLLAKSNADAFTELYNRYWNKLFHIAANKLNNLPESEELVQDIFLDLWNRRTVLHVTSGLDSYLAVAVKYKVINILARRNLQLCYSKQVVITGNGKDLSTEHWLNFEELKDRLGDLVAALPEKCRFVFKLSRDEGLSQKEIASGLGISEKTVESHLSKAIRSLRSGLEGLFMILL